MSDPNRRTNLTANVHRFRDHVAVSVGRGETVYLTPAQADSIASAIAGASASIRTEPFVTASVEPVTIKIN